MAKNSGDNEEIIENITDKVYRENNHIYFYTEITRETISRFNILLREAEEYCIITSYKLRLRVIPIYFHIYSNGGLIYSAFAAIDAIQLCSVPVYSIIEGATASAGTLISIMCKKRFIQPHAYMLIHQLRSELWGKMNEIEDEFQNLNILMERITQLYKNHSQLSEKKLKKLLKRDLWLNASQALKYGLVDSISNQETEGLL
jgi:ATP-dependent protease ClpP protease subunit